MKGENMKFVFVETGEICHYRHLTIEGRAAVLVTRNKDGSNEQSRYYVPTAIEELLNSGEIKLFGVPESE